MILWFLHPHISVTLEYIKLAAFWTNIESFLCILCDIFPASLGDSSPYVTGDAHISEISSTLLTSFSCYRSCSWAYCSVFLGHYSLLFLLLRSDCSNQAVYVFCALKENQNCWKSLLLKPPVQYHSSHLIIVKVAGSDDNCMAMNLSLGMSRSWAAYV